MSDPARPSPAIIIVNYRTPGLVIDCLETLEPERADVPGLLAVVVENGSGDDSAEVIDRAIRERGWQEWARVIVSPTNVGFAEGNNVALRQVVAERYLLLNSDTLVRRGALARLMEALDRRPDVGLVGPRMEFPDGAPQSSCFRRITPLSALVIGAQTGPISRLLGRHVVPMPPSDEPVEPDWIGFPCVLIRGEVVRQVGLLDPGFFMYFDDIDYCLRARAAGWGLLYCPEARVGHLLGQSGPTMQVAPERKRRPAYYYEARTRYFAKYYGRVGLWMANVLWLAGRSIAAAREVVGHKAPHARRHEARDNWTNWRDPLAARTARS